MECFSDDLPAHSHMQYSRLKEQSCSRQVQYHQRLEQCPINQNCQNLGPEVVDILASVQATLFGRIPVINPREPSLVTVKSCADCCFWPPNDHGGQAIHLSEDGITKNSGLVRSQSYPPEGFLGLGKKYILKVSKTAQNPTENLSQDQVPCTDITKDDRSIFTASPSPSIASVSESSVKQIKKEEPLVDVTGLHTKKNGSLKVEDDELVLEMSKGSSKHAVENVETSRISSTSICAEERSSLSASASQHGLNCCPRSGKALDCGKRPAMEDMAAIAPSFITIPCGMMGMSACDEDSPDESCDLHFFGVYDGHGGSQASSYCAERFHILIANELHNRLSMISKTHEPDQRLQWEKLMTDCFSKIDREVGGICPSGMCYERLSENICNSCDDAISPENVGTTAVIAVVGPCQIVLANCGDSRAVLSRGGKTVSLSNDHKPERADETSRIEAAGGRIIYYSGHRVEGSLALSRAIGDRYLKAYVISDPEVTCTERNLDDECLILASDGLWDVMSSDCACEIARRVLTVKRKQYKRSFPHGKDQASSYTAGLLAKMAHERGSKDNITVIVVDLKS